MNDERMVTSDQRTAPPTDKGWRGRLHVLAVIAAVATGIASSVLLGPVPTASAAPPYTTILALASEFTDATPGTVISLTQDLTGTPADVDVEVPEGGSVTLDLNGYSLTLVASGDSAGLGVPAGTSLTVEDSAGGGSLTVSGGTNGAGIGGRYSTAGGAVTVTGGTVTATGGEFATGIGGGALGDGGQVVIGSGAMVTASSAAGFAVGGGTGGGFGSLSNAGTLTIPVGNAITVPSGTTVNNTGTIVNEGTLGGDGTYQNDGIVLNSGAISSPPNVTVHNFAIHLDANSPDGAVPADPAPVYASSFEYGQVAFPPDATRTDYAFTGWYTAATGGNQVTATTDLGTGGPTDLTLYAQWRVNQYTVVFDSAGGSTVAPVTVDHDIPVTQPSDPTWAGHTFAGWYTAKDGGTAWDFNTPITSDVTLYAHWGSAGPVLAASGSDLAAWPMIGVGLLLFGGGAVASSLTRRQTRARQ